jgi:RNA polymerase sigma-70 factor (ECF subfamily)
MVPSRPTEGVAPADARFRTTHWSVVLAAGRDDSSAAAVALETLCGVYWRPLYAFARRQGHSPDDARDLIQEFFAHLLKRQPFAQLDREGGLFRSWLLTALKRFLINEWRQARAAKRGGGRPVLSLDAESAEEHVHLELADKLTPEMIYERCWAEALMERVQARLAREYADHRLGFETLQEFLVEPKGQTRFAGEAARLGVTESALKAVVFRCRRRLRELFHEEVANTVSRPEELEAEMRHVRQILSG